MSVKGQDRMRGITLVAPPKPIGIDALKELKDVNAEWVALVPYGFSKSSSHTKTHLNIDGQWWGETKDGLTQCILYAQECGLKIMIKPQVYIHESWVGHIDFDTEKEWTDWEESYRAFIIFYAQIAAQYKVDLLCIGTEYSYAAKKRPQFWTNLIQEIRSFYNGKLIFSSNWDNYENIPFWEQLDYIGISSYFPLTDQKTPTIHNLVRKWQPIKKKLKKFAKSKGKSLVFTEYGYLTVDQCAWNTWELEKDVKNRNLNEQAQANAYHALLKTYWEEAWWAGGFLWKWFPEDIGHEGYLERDYTPQYKKSAEVIKEWYGKQ